MPSPLAERAYCVTWWYAEPLDVGEDRTFLSAGALRNWLQDDPTNAATHTVRRYDCWFPRQGSLGDMPSQRKVKAAAKAAKKKKRVPVVLQREPAASEPDKAQRERTVQPMPSETNNATRRRVPAVLAKQVFAPVENRLVPFGRPGVEDRPTEFPCDRCEGDGMVDGKYTCTMCNGKGTVTRTMRELFPGLYQQPSQPGSKLQQIAEQQVQGFTDTQLVEQRPCGACEGRGDWREDTKEPQTRMHVGFMGHEWWCPWWGIHAEVTPF